jgi:tRNA modification GTPase
MPRYLDQSTIFAPASPVQKSGVAIIRISGSQAASVLKNLIQKKLPAPRQAILSGIYHLQTKELIDRALVIWFSGPASFTGEDVAELHVHGSVAVLSMILEMLAAIPGLRLAEPGEFSRRAFMNGKMDLTAAEGLADLIDAETRLQARQAISQMEGRLHTLYQSWRKTLISMQARLEAYIDFPDEEIPDAVLSLIEENKEKLQNNIKNHLADNHRGERLRKGLHVVILGPPNAGKSSLLNTLAKRDVAIVSEFAGTTRDVLDVHLDISGYPVILSDTAGLRDEGDSVEREGIKRALNRAEQADLVLLLLDATSPRDSWNHFITQAGENAIIAINKIDLLQETCAKTTVDGHEVVLLSVEQQLGIDALLLKLEKKATHLMADGKGDSPLVTRTRHRQLLQETLEHLSLLSLENGDLVLNAEYLRCAAHSLGQIMGRIDVEDILDELFSQFCIGK